MVLLVFVQFITSPRYCSSSPNKAAYMFVISWQADWQDVGRKAISCFDYYIGGLMNEIASIPLPGYPVTINQGSDLLNLPILTGWFVRTISQAPGYLQAAAG